MIPPESVIEYVSIPLSFTGSWNAPRYFDEPFPLTLSRYLWLMSACSQKVFEVSVMAFGKN